MEFFFTLLISAAALAAVVGFLSLSWKMLKWMFLGVKRLLHPVATALLFLGSALGGAFLGFMPWSLFLLGLVIVVFLL